MDDLLSALRAVLHERLVIVADDQSRRDPDRHMQRLQEVSERLEAIEHRLPRDINPQLRHYLQRRSYSKALEYLGA